MAERRDDGQASGPVPDAGQSVEASTGSATLVVWTTVIRRVIFGLLVGALVSALGARLAMDVAQISALDAEERPSVMRIGGKSAPVRMDRAQPPTAWDRGGRRGQ
jgi:hypothetical protein